MARITLSDGRTVPVVKPHLGDQMELERQMRQDRKKYGPKDFQEDLKISTFQTAFTLFASFNRAGVPTTIQDILTLDLDQLGDLITLEPGDSADDDESESEGEQSEDPQPAPTGDADGQ